MRKMPSRREIESISEAEADKLRDEWRAMNALQIALVLWPKARFLERDRGAWIVAVMGPLAWLWADNPIGEGFAVVVMALVLAVSLIVIAWLREEVAEGERLIEQQAETMLEQYENMRLQAEQLQAQRYVKLYRAMHGTEAESPSFN